jgi:hypothetical protein
LDGAASDFNGEEEEDAVLESGLSPFLISSALRFNFSRSLSSLSWTVSD